MACHCCGGSSLSKISPGNNLWQLFVHEDCCILLKMYIFFTHWIHDYSCRDGEELDSQGDASSQPDTISIASRTSQNTMDSDKVRNHSLFSIQTATRATGVSLARTPHPYVISPSAGVSPSSEEAARGKLWPAIFCTREPIELSELYGSRHVCVRESSLAVIGPS